MQPRTKRQKEIFEYISQFIESRGYKPSYQQIAMHFQLASKAAVANHIAALERQGLISRRRENGSFSLELNPKETAGGLVCGIEWIPAPGTSDAAAEEPLLVPAFLTGGLTADKLLVFRVRNESMIGDHICEGDIALIERRSFARDGDTVVATVRGERLVLKKIFRDGANVELRPSNPTFEPIRVPADKVDVKGIFRGLIRPLT
jgi:repressor LexA